MLRRSNSASHIPVPRTSDSRKRSRSVTRSSIKDNVNSTKKTRTGSTDSLSGPSFKRSTGASKKITVTTPTVSHSSGLFYKRSSNTITPASCSKSRSPYQFGSAKGERNVNDKKWVAEQFAKVRRYIQQHPSCHDQLHDLIKPPTINTFAFIIELLLRELDPRVEVTLANYKEVVLSKLKMFRYPGNISNSVLKTVNTMHNWPQVISIFAWLIDLIHVIKRSEIRMNPKLESDVKYKKIECVTDYLTGRYLLYNNNEDQKIADDNFQDKFERILNIDRKENERLSLEVKELHETKEKLLKKLTEQKGKNDEIKNENEDLQTEIDTFYMDDDQNQQEYECVIKQLKDRRNTLEEDIKLKNKNIAKLKEIISKQSCTFEEKKKTLMHIDEMKHTNNLKKESITARKAVKDECDYQLTEARKKVESEVYRLNNDLMKLAMIEPNLKILQLRDTNFLMEDFREEIKNLLMNKQKLEQKINEDIAFTKSLVSQIKTENGALKQQIEITNKKIQLLNKQKNKLEQEIQKYENEMDVMMKQAEADRNIISQNINKLKESEPNIGALKIKLTQLRELKKEKQKNFDQLKEKSLAFFVKLHDQEMSNLMDMNEIRSSIADIVTECLTEVGVQETEILEDLHKLDDTAKNN